MVRLLIALLLLLLLLVLLQLLRELLYLYVLALGAAALRNCLKSNAMRYNYYTHTEYLLSYKRAILLLLLIQCVA
jgi:hypothetical protein